ncbi:MAG: hypothetical protein LVR00_09510 [Rhabdochlamydiaceae bacterium]
MDRITTLFPSFPVGSQDIATRFRSNLGPQCIKVANCASKLFASARASQLGRTLSSFYSNKWAPVVLIAGLLLVIMKLFRDLTKANEAVKASNAALSTQALKTLVAVGQAEKDVKEISTQLASLAISRDEATAQLATLTVEHDAATAQLATLTGERDAATAQLATLTGERDAATAQLATLKGQHKEATAKLTTLTRDHDKALAKLAKANEAKEKAIKEVSEVREEIRKEVSKAGQLEELLKDLSKLKKLMPKSATNFLDSHAKTIKFNESKQFQEFIALFKKITQYLN